jgi:hypothetical protein
MDGGGRECSKWRGGVRLTGIEVQFADMTSQLGHMYVR